MKSNQFKSWKYVGDTFNTAKIFNEKDVDELLFLDVQASTKEQGPDFEKLIKITSECFLPIGYGGGITSVQQAKNVVNCGVDKVFINSAFLLRPQLVEAVSDEIGSSSTVVSLDISTRRRKFVVRDPKTGRTSDKPMAHFLDEAQRFGAGEILIQCVEKDGTKSGPNLELCEFVTNSTSVPIIYSGGVSSVEQAGQVWRSGVDGVAAGAWFVFKGPHDAVLVSYPERKKIMDEIYRHIGD